MTSMEGLDQDPLSRVVKQEFDDPDMNEKNRRLKLLVGILRPFVKFLFEWHINRQQMEPPLKRIHYVVQNVFRALESSPANVKVVVSNLNHLKSLKEEIDNTVSLHNNTSSFSELVPKEKAEVVVSFINSLLQNLKDIIISEPRILISLKKQVEELEEGRQFLINFLWLLSITNQFFDESEKKKALLNSAQKLAVKIVHRLFCCFVNDDELVGDRIREGILPNLLRKMHKLVLEIIQVYHRSAAIRLPDGNPTMNEHVLGFVEFLVHKLIRLLPKSNNEAGFMARVKLQIEILVDELRFLRCSFMDLLLQVPNEDMTISTLDLIIETGILVYLSLGKQKSGELMDKDLRIRLPVLLQAVETLRQQASDLFNTYFPPSKCPRTNELDFVDNFIEEVKDLMCSEAASITPLKRPIEMVNEEIVTLRKCFREITELGNSQLEFLLTRFRDAAYIAKYVIDSFIAGQDSLWFQKLGLYVATKDIRIMKKEMNVHNVAMASSCASSQANNIPSINAAVDSKVEVQNKLEEANKLVGLKDATKEIMDQLIGGSRQLKVLSIVGMPGLGKTSLANSVYTHASINISFHVRAWCCISQAYDKETVLFSILSQIAPETNQSQEISGEDMILKLYQNLKGRRFLIVLDDIWDIEAWNGLKEIFPDDENWSRILFTTRSHGVALESKSLPHHLRLRSNEESYELLSNKLFNGETCPEELSIISKRIASSCKGLPLTVVLIAGTLKRTKKEKDSWEQVAETLIRSHIIPEQILKILEVSYKHLPDCLKPCFCYFGTFPEGTTIAVSKLIRLWISEGFVKQPNFGQKSLKQEAESYLNELIDRSLVMIARKCSKGGVKACSVHDAIREFCTAKLEKERSVLRKDLPGGIAVLYGGFELNKQNLLNISSPTKVPHIRSLLYNNKSDTDTNSGEKDDPSELVEFRTSAGRNRNHRSELVFRDLLSLGRDNLSEQVFRNRRVVLGTTTSQRAHLNYGSILKYKHLGVLDLENVRLQNSANTSDLVKIAMLVHLKYLAVRVRTNEIPPEIGNLQNLETFLLSGAIGEVMLPEAIWKLASLKHILMDHSFFSFQNYSQEFFENSSQLNNLESIYTLFIRDTNDEEFLRRLPNIQKLGCIFPSSLHYYYKAHNLLRIFEFLRELESLQSLKMSFFGKVPYPSKFCFPPNLKKLTLSNSGLPWDELSAIGQLPNLEVLKLLDRAFEGQQWDMREGEFQKLKFLKLDSLNIILWNASSEHLPCLEQLLVLSCWQLEEIPSSFGEISTLQLIEMKWCSHSATDSVKQILKEQRDLSNDQLNVIVGRHDHFSNLRRAWCR